MSSVLKKADKLNLSLLFTISHRRLQLYGLKLYVHYMCRNVQMKLDLPLQQDSLYLAWFDYHFRGPFY